MEALKVLLGDVGYSCLLYGVGILAMAFSVVAFQFKHRVTIILSGFLGQSCWVLYFLLQADYTSAIACGLSAVVLAIFSKKDQWRWATSNWCIAVCAVVICGFSLLTFASWMDIFPLLAGFFCVIANSRSTERRLRQFSLLWCAFWLTNSILKVYPVAFANDLLCTVSALISLIRYRKKSDDATRQ